MGTQRQFKSVRGLAFRDISRYIMELQDKQNLSFADCWYVTPSHMIQYYSKQNTRLNRQLGLHKINK